MMNIHKFISIILALILCSNFISCEKEAIEKPTKRLTQIVASVDNKTVTEIKIEYSKEKILRLTVDNEYYEDLYVDHNIVIKRTSKENSDCIYQKGENGNIIIDSEGKKYAYYPEGYIKTVDDIYFTYDSNWDLTNCKKKETDSSLHFSYTNIPNKGQLSFCVFNYRNMTTEDILLHTGFIGKASTHLPKSFTLGKEKEAYNIEYELDEEGYAQTIKITTPDKEEIKYSYKYEKL